MTPDPLRLIAQLYGRWLAREYWARHIRSQHAAQNKKLKIRKKTSKS